MFDLTWQYEIPSKILHPDFPNRKQKKKVWKNQEFPSEPSVKSFTHDISPVYSSAPFKVSSLTDYKYDLSLVPIGIPNTLSRFWSRSSRCTFGLSGSVRQQSSTPVFEAGLLSGQPFFSLSERKQFMQSECINCIFAVPLLHQYLLFPDNVYGNPNTFSDTFQVIRDVFSSTLWT